MKLSGAHIVLECLKEQGADTLFGYPGGAVIPFYDALYDKSGDFNHIRPSHEQGASHAADAYARVTGKVGVCVVTSGPGATNTVTGIANAYMDSVPMVVITGQVGRSLLGKDSFQEVDITGITSPITKHNFLVEDVKTLADTIRKAFKIARSGRPGPVLVDIPKDVFMESCEYESVEIVMDEKHHEISEPEWFERAAKEINSSKKPVLYVGGGVIISDSAEELVKIAKKGNIPVANTLMSLGSIDRDDELSLGMLGMHGEKETNMAVDNCDLLIAVGARFDDRVTGDLDKFAQRAKVIHMDIDAAEISKNREADIFLIGDLKDTLAELSKHIEEGDRSEWLAEIESYKVTRCVEHDEFVAKNILEYVSGALGANANVATDVGQHQMWTAQYWRFKTPRSFVTSGGLGTMGFGLGAAIGSQVGCPEKRTVLVTGDGSFRMNCNELATVRKHNLPIIILLFNNSTLGMVRQWQKLFQKEKYSETDIGNEVDYVKLAEAYNIDGHRARSLSDFKAIFDNIADKHEPVLIECIVNKDDCVYPIIPAGAGVEQSIVG
ncbi:acetolactate synthase large subunit [Andreesenia angusta]|uniref:Acetolactate synthase n=1 Tax=Andreesenia angusta TaxID=39480 RepID=A0A1S1V860_9FIRM|nr:biosynthetic-type acetolactate synthase large subunit [Andreesenia angusta]OHW62684.1 acetolactate synthase large subunit [Andreesenia angusta]